MPDTRKTLADLTAEINAAKADDIPANAPNKNAVRMPVLSEATREQMLVELAEKFGTTPEEVAAKLMVGDPVAIEQSPDLEKRALPVGTKLIPVMLARDYWAHPYSVDQWPVKPRAGLPGDNRFPAGSSINLPGGEARRLIATGAATRNDPMPDDVD